MQKFTFLILGVILTLAGWTGVRAYQWKHSTDKRGYYAEVSGAYLFNPSGVLITATGEELTRQQLLDVLLHNAVEQTPTLTFKK